MKQCACGTTILADWRDCGSDRCQARSRSLDAERQMRTERFEDLLEVADYNREFYQEQARRTQEVSQTIAIKIRRRMAHQALKDLYVVMRRMDATLDEG